MKNLFTKRNKKKIPDEIAARQVSFKVLKKKTSFEADRRESTQQTSTDAAKFLQRMESIGEVHMDFNNEDMHDELDLIHRHKKSTRQSKKGIQEHHMMNAQKRREVKQSQRNAMAAPIQKLGKMDLHGHDQRAAMTRPRSGSYSNHNQHQNRDLTPAAAATGKTPSSQAVPQTTETRPVRKAAYKRGSMDVCLGFEDSGSEVSKDVNSPPPRKRRSLDMTDNASDDIVQPNLHSMEVDPRIAALHAAAHNMQKQQFEDRRRIHPEPRGPIDNIKPDSMRNRQPIDAEMMNRKRVLQKQVSMPEEAPRQMAQQQFIKQQSMRQFAKAEHEARQVQLLQKQQIAQQQGISQQLRSEQESRQMAQRQQMMKQQSVRLNSVPTQDQRQLLPKQHIMKQQSVRHGPVPLKESPREMQRQIPHQVMKEQQVHDLNRRSLVQDTARDIQAQVQQTANVWDEINSQQFDDRPQVKIQTAQVEQQSRNNMRPDHISAIPIKKSSSRERLVQRDHIPLQSAKNGQVLMRPDQISAIPMNKPPSRERLMQREQIPVKSMQNEQVLIRPDQISAIPIKKRSQPPQNMQEHFRQQGQISSRQLRGSPKIQPQRYPNNKEQPKTTTPKERPNLDLVRNNAPREQTTKVHLDQRKEHDEWYQSELQMPKVPSDQMLRARNARFHQLQKQQSVRTYHSNSSSESRGKDVRTEMMRCRRMNGQSTRTFESNSSSESRESARQSAQVSHHSMDTDVQNNKTDDMIEQMTIVKRRPTLKRGSMDTSLAIIEDL
ncbi:predicted protein [Chaetoceros tenuissimus]|uniref:Uncharacterized protein n=1 Tax=Chaetoceros tenuissimus TaxID=426638 RepID=A0AAD3HA19_9STRA|nr:predicted protein [Chaetoceros tenuissimus]